MPCEEVPVAELLAREPAINPRIRRAFRVPDGSIEPWQLIEDTVADARLHGSDALAYHRVVNLEVNAGRIVAVDLRDERSGTVSRVWTRFVVSAAGAWAGQIAALAGVTVEMTPGKGTMLIYNHRMTDAVINRCHKSVATATSWSPSTPWPSSARPTSRSRTPTTSTSRATRSRALVAEGDQAVPRPAAAADPARLRRRAAALPPAQDPAAEGGNRAITRAHAILDHADQGVDNYVSIVGGKLTTHRLMAEETVDVVAAKLGITERCTTATAPLPDQKPGHHYWLGHRLADIEAEGGGDADLLCECELVTRGMAEAYLDTHWPCTIDDVRRGTRVGMGPCQGAFCTFRVAGLVAERLDAADGTAPDERVAHAATADRALTGFLRERFKGTRPIAEGPPAPGAAAGERHLRRGHGPRLARAGGGCRAERRGGRGGRRCRSLTSS